MSEELLVIVPSRGRPQNVAELLREWVATAVHGTSALRVVVDEDDPALDGYVDTFKSVDFRTADFLTLEVGPRRWLGPTLNDVATAHCLRYRAIGFMGDDHRPRTDAWDSKMLAALDELDGTGVVYGNDLLQGGNLATQVVISSDVIRCLGFMVPPGMTHLYLDNFWLTLGHAIRRVRYLPDVVIEHLHPAAKKAEWDAGYAEVNSAQMYERDGAAWRHYAQGGGFERDAAKVRRELLGDP